MVNLNELPRTTGCPLDSRLYTYRLRIVDKKRQLSNEQLDQVCFKVRMVEVSLQEYSKVNSRQNESCVMSFLIKKNK